MDNKIDLSSLGSLFVKIYYNDIQLGSATAFIVNDNKQNYLVTNRHVVTGKNNITNKIINTMGAIPNKIIVEIPTYHPETNTFNWNKKTINLYDSNENPIWMEHCEYKEKMDVVAIKLDESIKLSITYSLDSSNFLCSICDNVKIIGYPFGYNINPKQGYFAIWMSGTIASEPLVNLIIPNTNIEIPGFLIDARTREGASGSPVIYYNRQGILPNNNGFSICSDSIRIPLGIYSGRISNESDLGIVWKWDVLKKIINSI